MSSHGVLKSNGKKKKKRKKMLITNKYMCKRGISPKNYLDIKLAIKGLVNAASPISKLLFFMCTCLCFLLLLKMVKVFVCVCAPFLIFVLL